MEEILTRIKNSLLYLAGTGSTVWNWTVKTDLGTLIANATGLLILLLLFRKLAYACVEDYVKLKSRLRTQRTGQLPDAPEDVDEIIKKELKL